MEVVPRRQQRRRLQQQLPLKVKRWLVGAPAMQLQQVGHQVVDLATVQQADIITLTITMVAAVEEEGPVEATAEVTKEEEAVVLRALKRKNCGSRARRHCRGPIPRWPRTTPTRRCSSVRTVTL